MMQFRNHVVVVVSLLVLGTSAILGATVQSTASCPIPVTTSQSENVATSELCASGIDAGCLPPPLPVRRGQHVFGWGVIGGCFSSKL
jgi:hypothetical protein